MKFTKAILSLCLIAILFSACQKEYVLSDVDKITILTQEFTLNPQGVAPLTASLALETSIPAKISIRVAGKHGAETDVIKNFSEVTSKQVIPILGLYPAFENTVEVIFKNASGVELARKTYTIKTDPLPADVFPAISIDTRQIDKMAPGMTLVSYFGYKGNNAFPQSPFVFDDYGDVRWYANFNNTPALGNLFFDDGMERLQNGNLYFGDISSNALYEMDMTGAIVNTWPLPGYQFHHNVQEKPNGNFLVSVSKQGSPTTEDYIIEIDRADKQIVNTWDLKASLQYSRQTLTTDPVDWIHVNAVIYDESDNTIIISGRTQGVVKLDKDNKVVWIMGCHKGWATAGNGVNLTNFLLQPLDNNNTPISSTAVLDGDANDPSFEWNWYQHAPLLMPNGHIMLFDNGGDNRNFSGAGSYSRAVEYEVNAANKTIKQVWQYGKERGAATFSHIVSDVDFISASNHVIFSPGAVNNTTNYGKAVEIDYATGNVIFEATLTPAQTFYGITLHRTERLSLYP